jgi:RIO kinase 1
LPRFDPRAVDEFDDFDDLDGFIRTRPPQSRQRRSRHWDATPDDPELLSGTTRSTYQDSRASQGPQPPPPWLITSSAAVDRDAGVIKTGKEADVHLVERRDPVTGGLCLLAAKRYRSSTHRLFHRDAGYLEGRRVRRSRENRAMAGRTDFGRQVIAGQWALAEFETLGWLWASGVAVPYPAQYGGTELLMEFIGDAEGTAAPRLAELRPHAAQLDDLWQQCRDALGGLADLGFTHGDLSAYNVLVDRGRLVLIDLPQVVDIVGNPQGNAFLRRDCDNISAWFAARGQPDADGDELAAALARTAGLR